MNRIKTIYFVGLLILFVALGLVAVIPEIIPSLEFVLQIIILVLYLANIVFAYIIVVRLLNYLRKKLDKIATTVLTSIGAIIVVGGLFISFIITSLGIGQGFMGGTLAKELNYPKHHVALYLYDNSFLDPLTTIKIKHKIWPIMKDLAFIENCQPSELTIWRHDDIVELSHDNVAVRINLITRNAEKIYTQTGSQN